MVASEATPFSKTGGLAMSSERCPPLLQPKAKTSPSSPRLSRQSLSRPPSRSLSRLPIPLAGGYLRRYLRNLRARRAASTLSSARRSSTATASTATATRISPTTRCALPSSPAPPWASCGICSGPTSSTVTTGRRRWCPSICKRVFHGDPTFIGARRSCSPSTTSATRAVSAAGVLPAIGLDPGVFSARDAGVLRPGQSSSKAASPLATRSAPSARLCARNPDAGATASGWITFLRTHAKLLTGIVNGVDYSEWSPETRPLHRRNTIRSDDLAGSGVQASAAGRVRLASGQHGPAR